MRIPVLIVLPVFLLAGLIPDSASAAGKAAKVTVASKKTAKEESLRQGMPAAEVLKIMGKPDDISPMEAPSGKAEVWTYRTRTDKGQTRYQINSRPITTTVEGVDGNKRQVVVGEEPIFGTERRTEVRTYQILMFNDHLLNDKVTTEEERSLE